MKPNLKDIKIIVVVKDKTYNHVTTLIATVFDGQDRITTLTLPEALPACVGGLILSFQQWFHQRQENLEISYRIL